MHSRLRSSFFLVIALPAMLAACSGAAPESTGSAEEDLLLPPRQIMCVHEYPYESQPYDTGYISVSPLKCATGGFVLASRKFNLDNPFEAALSDAGCQFPEGRQVDVLKSHFNVTVCLDSCGVEQAIEQYYHSSYAGYPIMGSSTSNALGTCWGPTASGSIYVIWDPTCANGCAMPKDPPPI
jgi:hypothetical protein